MFIVLPLGWYIYWWTISPLCLYYYHLVDTSTGGLLVPYGITRSVVCIWALAWLMWYIYFWHSQFLIVKTNDILTGSLSWFWLSCLGILTILQFTISDSHFGICKLFLAFLIKSSKRDVVMMCNLLECFLNYLQENFSSYI